MERPTKSVKLPTSGWTAHVAEYYTVIERERIDRIMLDKTKLTYTEGQAQIREFPASWTIDDTKAKVREAVKALTDDKGNKIDKVTDEILGGLPESDMDVIVEALPAKKKLITSLPKKA